MVEPFKGRFIRHLERPRALEAMLFATQASGMLASVIISRELGPTGRGHITTLIVWSQLIGWITAFSLDKAVVVLSRLDQDDPAPVASAFIVARRYIAVLALPTATVSFAIGQVLFHDWTWSIMLALGTVATSFAEIGAGWLLATKKMAWFILYRMFQPALYMIAVVALTIILRHDVYSVRLNAMAASVVASLVIPAVIVHLRTPLRLRQPIDRRRLRNFAATTQIANAMQYLNSRLDILCLSVFSSPRQVGIYAVGLAAGQAAVVLGTAGIVRGITGLTKSLDRKGIILTLSLGVAIAALSPFIIPLVFGSAFAPSVHVAQILGIGASVNYALQSSDGLLLGMGKPSLVAIGEVAGAAAFGIGIAISLNLEVVALADVASYAVSLVIAQYFLHKRTEGV